MGNHILGDRIKQKRTELQMTQGDIADQIGVAISTVQRYEKGQIDKIKLPVVEAIARVLGVSPEWLIGKTDIETNSTDAGNSLSNIIPVPTIRKIPLIGQIACGKPILAIEEATEIVDVPDQIHADFALICKGDSMINARIFDGDIVYIRSQPTVETGEIAAVRIDDEATLKRVRLFEDHISLEAENPMYKPLVYWGDDMNNVQILGKAVAFTSVVI